MDKQTEKMLNHLIELTTLSENTYIKNRLVEIKNNLKANNDEE